MAWRYPVSCKLTSRAATATGSPPVAAAGARATVPAACEAGARAAPRPRISAPIAAAPSRAARLPAVCCRWRSTCSALEHTPIDSDDQDVFLAGGPGFGRRGRDSNPGDLSPGPTVFKTAAFNRSATPPGGTICRGSQHATHNVRNPRGSLYTGRTSRRGGRVAEGTRLLSEYGGQTPSRVRIPPSPFTPAPESLSESPYITAIASYTSTLPPLLRTGLPLASSVAAARLSAFSTE